VGSRWLLRKSTFPEGRGPVLKDLPAPPFWEGEAPAEPAHLWEGEAPAEPNTHRTPLWEGEAPAEPNNHHAPLGGRGSRRAERQCSVFSNRKARPRWELRSPGISVNTSGNAVCSCAQDFALSPFWGRGRTRKNAEKRMGTGVGLFQPRKTRFSIFSVQCSIFSNRKARPRWAHCTTHFLQAQKKFNDRTCETPTRG